MFDNSAALDQASGMKYGRHGWYEEMPNGRMQVVVTSALLLNRHFNRHRDWKYQLGLEDTFYLGKAEFDRLGIHRLLQVDMTRQPELQIFHDYRYASGERVEEWKKAVAALGFKRGI